MTTEIKPPETICGNDLAAQKKEIHVFRKPE